LGDERKAQGARCKALGAWSEGIRDLGIQELRDSGMVDSGIEGWRIQELRNDGLRNGEIQRSEDQGQRHRWEGISPSLPWRDLPGLGQGHKRTDTTWEQKKAKEIDFSEKWYILAYTHCERRTPPMESTARLFQNGRSQAVRLPKAFRFKGREVKISVLTTRS